MESSLRLFSLYMAYISFFARLIIALVYWKDSLDFDNIMLGKRNYAVAAPVNASPSVARKENNYIRTSPTNKNVPSNVFF